MSLPFFWCVLYFPNTNTLHTLHTLHTLDTLPPSFPPSLIVRSCVQWTWMGTKKNNNTPLAFYPQGTIYKVWWIFVSLWPLETKICLWNVDVCLSINVCMCVLWIVWCLRKKNWLQMVRGNKSRVLCSCFFTVSWFYFILFFFCWLKTIEWWQRVAHMHVCTQQQKREPPLSLSPDGRKEKKKAERFTDTPHYGIRRRNRGYGSRNFGMTIIYTIYKCRLFWRVLQLGYNWSENITAQVLASSRGELQVFKGGTHRDDIWEVSLRRKSVLLPKNKNKATEEECNAHNQDYDQGRCEIPSFQKLDCIG